MQFSHPGNPPDFAKLLLKVMLSFSYNGKGRENRGNIIYELFGNLLLSRRQISENKQSKNPAHICI